MSIQLEQVSDTKGLSSREAARGHASSVDGILESVTKFRINNCNKLLFPVDHVVHYFVHTWRSIE